MDQEDENHPDFPPRLRFKEREEFSIEYDRL